MDHRRVAEWREIREREAAEWESKKTPQTASFSGVGKGQAGPGRGNKGIARKIAEATGLSDDTVRRALKPAPKVIRPVPVLSPSPAFCAAIISPSRLA